MRLLNFCYAGYSAVDNIYRTIMLWSHCSNMANPSISVDDDVLMEFDDVIWELKKQEEIDRGTSRSEVIQHLMEEWITEHR